MRDRVRLVVFACLLGSAGAGAWQSPEISWLPPVAVSNDSAISNLPRCIVDGDTVHLFWFGIDEFLTLSQDGTQYARSTDGGLTFSTPVSLLSYDVTLSPPQPAGSGRHLYVAVGAVFDTTYGAILLRSTDGGSNWDAPRFLKAGVFPRLIAAEDSLVSIHYTDPVTRFNGILTSTDHGGTWSVANGAMTELTDMLLQDGVLHAVGPSPSRIDEEIGYFYSPNRGASWIGPDLLSSQDVTRSERASLSVNERGNLFAVWSDTGKVMTRSSRNNGISWTPQILLSSEIGTATTDIASGKGFAAVAWDVDVAGIAGIWIRLSDDYGAHYAPASAPVTSKNASEPSVSITGNTIHLVWHQHEGGAAEIYYRRGTVEDNPDLDVTPRTYALRQNFPNPFNGVSRIEYQLPAPSRVVLTLYSLLGERIAVLTDADQPVGRYAVAIDGNGLASGIYFYQLRTESFTETKKLTVVR